MKGILSSILVFALLNGALYFGQEWYYSSDVNKSDELKISIDKQKHAYIRLEYQLEEIAEKAEEANSEREWDELNNVYNSLLIQYDNVVQSYNKNVEEYNRLIEKCGTRWYVIPIPRCGGKSCR